MNTERVPFGLLLVVTLIPLLFTPYAAIELLGTDGTPPWFRILFAFMWLWSLVVVGLYGWIMWNDPAIREERALWILLLIFGSVITELVYLFVYRRKQTRTTMEDA
jgi:hypothetical protein